MRQTAVMTTQAIANAVPDGEPGSNRGFGADVPTAPTAKISAGLMMATTDNSAGRRKTSVDVIAWSGIAAGLFLSVATRAMPLAYHPG